MGFSGTIDQGLVLQLALDGHRPFAIAQRVGCTAAYVRHLMRKARRKGHPVPRHKGVLPTALGIRLSDGAKASLIEEASRRGKAVGPLVGALVEAIATDNLFEAVLGDGA